MLYIIGTNREREQIERNWKESSEIFIPIDRGYLFFDTHYLGNTQIHLCKSFIMSDNRDYMTLHLQTFSLSVRFFLKLNYTLTRKKKTRSKHLCPRIPNEALSGSSSACDKHDAHETYYLIQSTRPARHSIPFGVDRNSVTRNTGEKRRIARNAWPRRRGHDRVIAP